MGFGVRHFSVICEGHFGALSSDSGLGPASRTSGLHLGRGTRPLGHSAPKLLGRCWVFTVNVASNPHCDLGRDSLVLKDSPENVVEGLTKRKLEQSLEVDGRLVGDFSLRFPCPDATRGSAGGEGGLG